jgi:hypothetical protein
VGESRFPGRRSDLSVDNANVFVSLEKGLAIHEPGMAARRVREANSDDGAN